MWRIINTYIKRIPHIYFYCDLVLLNTIRNYSVGKVCIVYDTT